MLFRSLPRVAGPLVLGLGLLMAPHLSWAQAQRGATPAPLMTTTPTPVPTPTPLKAPSAAQTLVESDMPLCSETDETLPSDVSVKFVECKASTNVACMTVVTFYGATPSCYPVFIKPIGTPTPLPAS
jgi:hypothetical protein